MYEIFTKLLNMSLMASILVLIIIVLRFALKKAPKKYICILWALVAFRLICPFSISSVFSAYNVLDKNTISSGQVEYFEYNGKTEKPQLTFEVPALVNDNYSPDSMTVGTKTSGVYMPTVVYIWLFGIISMAAYAIVSYAELYKEVKASIKKDDNVYVCDEISSPFILGFIRPRIYLPSGISEEVREHVVAHEKAHIKRLDYIWKPLGFVLLSVYWFNPVMWIAYIFLCKDIEGACDEKVISQMDKESIASYSQALLTCAAQRRMITACPIAFGETDVRGRIKNVLNYKKPAFWIICISIVSCIVVAVCFLTNPKKDKNCEVPFGTYVKNDLSGDTMLYWSGLTINEDGTFTYSPSVISSYMGVGTWTIDGDYITFNDTRMGDVRREVFQYIDGNLYYVAAKSASNSMWGLTDGTEYILGDGSQLSNLVEKNKTKEELWDYPIKDWESARSRGLDFMGWRDVCNPSEEMLSNLSTERLARLAVRYPLFPYMPSGATDSEADIFIGVYADYSSIFRELLTREDRNIFIIKEFAQNEPDIATYNSGAYIENESIWIENFVKQYLLVYSKDMTSEEREAYLEAVENKTEKYYSRIEEGLADFGLFFDANGVAYRKSNELTDVLETEANRNIHYSEYTYDLLFNFGGKFYLSDAYEDPAHGDYTPDGWHALGGEGECIDPSFSDRETFVNGKLIAYNWLDNHSDYRYIMPFSVGGYSCCLYQYSFDMFTAPDLEMYPDADPTSEYWVVFYTEGEGKPLYIKFFHCDYFTQEQAMENIAPSFAIILGTGIYEENLGVSYYENPDTHHYVVDGDMVLKYKKSLIGKDPKSEYSVQYIVLTNDENVTWEEVNNSLYSRDSNDWLYDTIIIGMNTIWE